MISTNNTNEDLLRFDQGVMTLSAYDPLLDQYQAPRVLQLPELPLLESLEHMFISVKNASNGSTSIRPTKSTRFVHTKSKRYHDGLVEDDMDKDMICSSTSRRRRCQSNPNLAISHSATAACTTATTTTSPTNFTATMTRRALHKFGSLTRRMSKRSIKTAVEEETVSIISHASRSSSNKIRSHHHHHHHHHHHKRSLSTAFQAALTGMIQKANKKLKHKTTAIDEHNGWVQESWVEELRFSTESVVSLYSLNQPWPYQRRPSSTSPVCRRPRSRKTYKEKHEPFVLEAWWSSRSSMIQRDNAAATAF